MTQGDGGYDLKPEEPRPPAAIPAPVSAENSQVDGASPPPASGPPKPGKPGWVPPVPVIEKADPEPEEEPADPDVEKNKGMALLGYVCFLIPLLAAPKSNFARFHANQGLLTFLIWCAAMVGIIILWAVHAFLGALELRQAGPPILFGFFGCILWLLQPVLLLGALAASIYGVIQAANGEKKGLPLIGQIVLIK